jgi:TRAP-type mannitol/chloroaromatic compound transport system permease small subunit
MCDGMRDGASILCAACRLGLTLIAETRRALNHQLLMSGFPPLFFAVIRRIDRFTEATGKLVALLMLFLVASISYECFSRYLFASPTIWVYDTSYMANGMAYMLGCGYALFKGAHVRTDMLWGGFSERRKGTIDLASYLLLFFPTMLVLFAISVDDAWRSFELHETSEQTPWRPLMWPFRAAVPLAAVLLMIQGVSEALKSWFQIRTGREFEHRERVEV